MRNFLGDFRQTLRPESKTLQWVSQLSAFLSASSSSSLWVTGPQYRGQPSTTRSHWPSLSLGPGIGPWARHQARLYHWVSRRSITANCCLATLSSMWSEIRGVTLTKVDIRHPKILLNTFHTTHVECFDTFFKLYIADTSGINVFKMWYSECATIRALEFCCQSVTSAQYTTRVIKWNSVWNRSATH